MTLEHVFRDLCLVMVLATQVRVLYDAHWLAHALDAYINGRVYSLHHFILISQLGEILKINSEYTA
jgi:hypothetical protein